MWSVLKSWNSTKSLLFIKLLSNMTAKVGLFTGDTTSSANYATLYVCTLFKMFLLQLYYLHNLLLLQLKKQYSHLHLKLPGKKFFGNNFSTDFIKSRRQGLDSLVQRMLSDPRVLDQYVCSQASTISAIILFIFQSRCAFIFTARSFT